MAKKAKNDHGNEGHLLHSLPFEERVHLWRVGRDLNSLDQKAVEVVVKFHKLLKQS